MIQVRNLDNPRQLATVGFVAVIGLCAVALGIGLFHGYAFGEGSQHRILQTQRQGSMTATLYSLALEQAHLVHDPLLAANRGDHLAALRSRYQRLRAELGASTQDPNQARLLEAEYSLSEQLSAAQDRMLLTSADETEAQQRNTRWEAEMLERARLERLASLLRLQQSQLETALLDRPRRAEHPLVIPVSISLLALALSGLIAYRTTRRLSQTSAAGADRSPRDRHAPPDDWHLVSGELPDAVIVADREGRITAWNGGAARVCGWPRQDCADTPLSEVLARAGAQASHSLSGAMPSQPFRRRAKDRTPGTLLRQGRRGLPAFHATFQRVASGSGFNTVIVLQEPPAQESATPAPRPSVA